MAFFYTTLVFFLVLCFFFVLLILVQKGRGGGISSAFGGAGGNTAFGSKTGDVLTWATSVVFALFLVFCVGLNLMATRINDQQTKGDDALRASEGTGTATPATAPATPADTSPLSPADPNALRDRDGNTPVLPVPPQTTPQGAIPSGAATQPTQP